MGKMDYGSTGCAACHCPDATGGWALEAPTILGAPADELNARLLDPATHPIRLDR